jgi:hypothetical protein
LVCDASESGPSHQQAKGIWGNWRPASGRSAPENARYRRFLDIAGATRDFRFCVRQGNMATSRHVILTIATEANMTQARLEMLGLWIFLMLIIVASHLYQ